MKKEDIAIKIHDDVQKSFTQEIENFTKEMTLINNKNCLSKFKSFFESKKASSFFITYDDDSLANGAKVFELTRMPLKNGIIAISYTNFNYLRLLCNADNDFCSKKMQNESKIIGLYSLNTKHFYVFNGYKETLNCWSNMETYPDWFIILNDESKKSFRAALISYIKESFPTLESVDSFYENKFGEKLDADKERDINQAKLYLERNTIPTIDTWLAPVFEDDEIRTGHIIYEKEFSEKYLPIYLNEYRDKRRFFYHLKRYFIIKEYLDNIR